MLSGENEAQVEDTTDAQLEGNDPTLSDDSLSASSWSFSSQQISQNVSGTISECSLSFSSSDREDGEEDVHNLSSALLTNPLAEEVYTKFKQKAKFVRTQLQK